MNMMVSKIAFALLIGLGVFSASAAAVTKSIENVSVKTMMITTSPDLRYAGSLSLPPSKARFTNHWMAITVEFTPRYHAPKGKTKVSAAMGDDDLYTQQRYLDNVEVKVRALCETIGPQGRPQYALFSGSSKLWYIKLDGTKHYLVFFIPPWVLDRYYYPHSRLKASKNNRSRAAVKGMTDVVSKMNKSNLIIEAAFVVNNSTLAAGYANITDTKKNPGRNNFNKLLEKVSAGYSFENAVLSKAQSPWAYMDINLFDPEKPVNAK